MAGIKLAVGWTENENGSYSPAIKYEDDLANYEFEGEFTTKEGAIEEASRLCAQMFSEVNPSGRVIISNLN